VSSFKDYTLFCGDFQINLGANFKDIVNSELNPYFEDTIADKLGALLAESKGNEKSYSARSQLTWTHFRTLMRIDNELERNF